MSRSELLRVTYRLEVDERKGLSRAEDVAIEQTAEVPRAAVRDRFVREEVLGRVEEIRPDGPGACLATIAYPVAITAFDPSQLVNVVFGNSSLHPDVECIDIDVPPSLLSAMGGPRFGIEGLRKELGVHDRALTCTAVKPLGLSPAALADLFRDFARAGIDVIKDDHSLADHAFCPFEERVQACMAAAAEVADETGHRAIYAPNLTGSPETLFARLRFAEECGARAVLVSPMLVGLPVFWELCRKRSSVPVLAHPAFGGAGRLAPELLFGKLLRLFGADAVIYVNFGSRFDIDREACRRIAQGLTRSWGELVPSLPVPAGGIAIENAADVADFYGPDVMLLVGGNLQIEAGAIEARARAFVEAVRGGE